MSVPTLQVQTADGTWQTLLPVRCRDQHGEWSPWQLAASERPEGVQSPTRETPQNPVTTAVNTSLSSSAAGSSQIPINMRCECRGRAGQCNKSHLGLPAIHGKRFCEDCGKICVHPGRGGRMCATAECKCKCNNCTTCVNGKRTNLPLYTTLDMEGVASTEVKVKTSAPNKGKAATTTEPTPPPQS